MADDVNSFLVLSYYRQVDQYIHMFYAYTTVYSQNCLLACLFLKYEWMSLIKFENLNNNLMKFLPLSNFILKIKVSHKYPGLQSIGHGSLFV